MSRIPDGFHDAHCQRLAGIVMLLMLNACAVGPDFVRPEPPAGDRYTRAEPSAATADGQTQHFAPGEKIAADWWRLFNSSELDAAVKQAIAGNRNLQSAQASLRQSQDNLRAGYGVFFPEIDLNFGATRQKISPLRFGPGSIKVGSIFNLFTLGATISYTLDVFGGERRAVEALGAEVDFQRYTVLATYLALSGNIVNTHIARAAYLAQIGATARLIERQREQLAIAQTQAAAGIVPYSNVLSIKSQLAANEAILPALRQKLDQADHLLATLLGQLPADWNPPRIDLASLTLPSDLPVSLPSQLVRQRPDILAAEAQLHAASANIGVVTAALFPSFSLSGAYSLNGTTIGNLSDTNNNSWSVGPAVNFPLFQGGTAWYKRKAAIDGYQKSLADYRQTVLSAFAQVADTLTALAHDAESLQAQTESLRSAEEALKLLQANYRAGLVSYLEVLVANVQFHQAEINYLQASAQRYQDTTALFIALGGGWWDADRSTLAIPVGRERQ